MIGLFAAALALGLHAFPLSRPLLVDDDIQAVVASWTWDATVSHLWVPANEHAMPLGRLSTWALLQLASRQSLIPAVAAVQGPLALLISIGLVYVFVGRELGHSFYGLAAMIFFGVTSVYQQAIVWFAASFSVLALVTFLLALLAAQRWRMTRQGGWLGLSALAAALAPAWFASGVLAGPLCTLYLLPRDADTGKSRPAWWCAFVPILGTLTFLAVSLPLTGYRIMHLAHYDGRTALESFDPWRGLVNTARSLVENLALGTLGISGVNCPNWLIGICLAALFAATYWWWRSVGSLPSGGGGRGEPHRLMLLGVALVLSSYWLAYSARADWQYSGVMNQPVWGRYHLLPQLGLSLFVAAGLPHWFAVDTLSGIPRRRAWALVGLVTALFLIQLPRGILAHAWHDPTAQQAALGEIERVDALCRAHQISAHAARSVLGWQSLPGCGDRENAWDLLRGSDTPRPLAEAEIRELLEAPQPATH